jgi:hypothetical protein
MGKKESVVPDKVVGIDRDLAMSVLVGYVNKLTLIPRKTGTSMVIFRVDLCSAKISLAAVLMWT